MIRILIVEDNPADAELVRDLILERQLGDVDVVNDGEQALNYLKRRAPFDSAPRPGFVLLDLNIPKLHGREVLRAVKSDQELRQIPILVFTSSEAERDIIESYDLNANCYIQKPTDLDEYSKMIDLLNEFWIKTVKLSPAEGR